MKKNLLNAFMTVSILTSVNSSKAQVVPNNSFENWTIAPTFQHPVVLPTPLFSSSNFETFYQYGLLNATEVPGVSGSAVRVENILSPFGDTLNGYCSWGNVNGGAMSDGVPLPAVQPLTGCNVNVRYNVNASTAGFIAFLPTTAGVASGAGNGIYPGAYIYPISGSQSTFTLMNYTFSPALTMNPDSCIIFVTCSDQIMTNLGTPGDFLEVDNFAWTGTTDVFLGGNLDVWQDIPAVEIPLDWTVEVDVPEKITFAKSMDAYAGNYSLLLKNIISGSDSRIGRAQMGSWDCPPGGGPCLMRPGMSIPSTPKGFGFYYKYSTPGVDTASAYVNLLAGGIGVTGNWMALLPSATWTFKSMNIPTPGPTPDSAFISFESGRWMTAVNNSTLLIDDVKFHYCNEVATIMGPTSVCANSSGVQFSINNEFASAYSWSTTTGIISGSSTSQMVTINNIATNGTITVIKTYGDGCPPMTFNLNITVTAASTANAGTNQTVCSAVPAVVVSGSVTGATGGNWTTSGTGTFANPMNLNTTYAPSAADIAASSVILTLTPTGTGVCPVTTAQITITFIPSPTVNAGLDQSVCFGNMATLNGAGAVSYVWNGGVTNGVAFASPIGTTVYTVTGTAANSCTNTDMVSVTTNPLPAVSFNLATDTVCDNDPSFALSGGMPTGGTYSGTGVSAGNFNPATSGIGTFSITYTYTDINSCQSMIAQNLVVENCAATGINTSTEMLGKMYPNPTSDILNIEISNNNKNYELILTDVTGREIFKTTSDKKVFVLDMSDYSNGVYFIRLVSETSTINKRIVKK